MDAMSDPSDLGIPGDSAAHDVLAAEEFALPAPDPSIGHAPAELPDDPSGIAEPHDVLSAEAFALPASPPHPGDPDERSRPSLGVPGVAALVALALLLAIGVWRRWVGAGRRAAG